MAYRIQSAFEIMGLNEHINFFCGFTKNRYSRYQTTKRLWFYRAGGCLTTYPQNRLVKYPKVPGLFEHTRQSSPLKHHRPYIVHGNTPILLVYINTLTSNTTEQISPKSPNLLKHIDRLPKHSTIYAERQSLFSLCMYMC